MKRRRVGSKRASAHSEVAPGAEEGETKTTTTAAAVAFPQLFGGKESAEAAALRKQVFDTAWPVLDGRIKVGSNFLLVFMLIAGCFFGLKVMEIKYLSTMFRGFLLDEDGGMTNR